jgi:hypothetical protein
VPGRWAGDGICEFPAQQRLPPAVFLGKKVAEAISFLWLIAIGYGFG